MHPSGYPALIWGFMQSQSAAVSTVGVQDNDLDAL